MQTVKKKRTYPSLAQKARMIALLESDKDLQRGKFTTSFSKRDAERRWRSIANNLNSLPGAKKAWTEWRKTWQDMKAAAKKKRLARRSMAEAPEPPGGGPAPDDAGDNAATMTLPECAMKFEGSPLTPESARRKWQALRDARASKGREKDGCDDPLSKYADLMSFLDHVDEFSEQYIDSLGEESVQEDPLDVYDNSPAEPEKTLSPTEKPKKNLNRQRILHQRTVRRFQYGLDPLNPQPENDDSDSEADLGRSEDGHTLFCLSLAPLMRSLPLQRVIGVRIKMLQLLRDAMEVE